MLPFKTYFLSESFDNPYRYKNTFTTEAIEKEDDDTGETYMDEVLTPVQIIRFKTDAGVPYLWYARQSRYDDSVWEIAFGVESGQDIRGETKLDIELTKGGDAFRVLATVIEIINQFIEFDDNNEIQLLTFTSKGANRTKLYKKRLVPMIQNFELDDLFKDMGEGESQFILSRKW
jgi:hypothetical protein